MRPESMGRKMAAARIVLDCQNYDGSVKLEYVATGIWRQAAWPWWANHTEKVI